MWNSGFQGFGQPVKISGQSAPVNAARPTPPPPPRTVPAPANQPKGFIPKSPGSSGCPVCK